MIISLVAAMSKNGVIGAHNQLPWHIPDELKYFKSLTKGKAVVMGRKTFLSIGCKALPHRLNIILSKNSGFLAPGCVVVQSAEAAIGAAEPYEELMIIGGSEIYKEFLPRADRIYLSLIHREVEGDTYFPAVVWEEWKLMDEKAHPEFTAQEYRRV